MATVPGDPSEPAPLELPEWMKPTMADFLQAASIMHEKGRFQVAGEVVPFTGKPRPQSMQELEDTTNKEVTRRVLGRALGTGKVIPIRPEGD